MPDIYDILSKHFLNETTAEEEQVIDDFKKNNPVEYSMLKRLWDKGDIEVKDFDSHKAWNIMQRKLSERRGAKVIKLPVFKRIMRVAAVVAFLLAGSYSAYYYSYILPGKQIVTASAGQGEKGKEIVLSDGTVVWLNKNSTLAYSEKFTGDKREVSLQGEAFFKVHHNAEKPFVITTPNAGVEVLGTSFNVKTNGDNTKVVVATGKVRVSNNSGSEKVVIVPGFSAEVSGVEVRKFRTDDPNYLAWKTGEFSFSNTSLRDVVNDLNTWYDDKLVLDAENGFDCKLTANFNKAALKDVLETIRLTCDVEIVQQDGKYIIK